MSLLWYIIQTISYGNQEKKTGELKLICIVFHKIQVKNKVYRKDLSWISTLFEVLTYTFPDSNIKLPHEIKR